MRLPWWLPRFSQEFPSDWFRRIRGRQLATCCDYPLSEWFINKGSNGWGMQCWFCKKVSPWMTHDEFRREVPRG